MIRKSQTLEMSADNNLNSDSLVNKPKTPMTDEERLKLAEKLDKELDEFIGGLEKRSYTEGWPEDRWEEVRFSQDLYLKLLKGLFVFVCVDLVPILWRKRNKMKVLTGHLLEILGKYLFNWS